LSIADHPKVRDESLMLIKIRFSGKLKIPFHVVINATDPKADTMHGSS
jgi:hypothetical protein